MAAEFSKALRELTIAPFEGTPGRPTSHGVMERSNRTVLEYLRPTLDQSGLSLDWSGMAAAHSLVIRRIRTTNAEGISIYSQKHPELVPPPIWAFGASVDFKPSLGQMGEAKAPPRGKKGILVVIM